MSTIGHPLSDIVNLTVPFLEVEPSLGSGRGRGQPEFHDGTVPGIPGRDEVLRWYKDIAEWDPTSNMAWGDAFGMFRTTVIVQGIASRVARGQASGVDATVIANQIEPFAAFTLKLMRKVEGCGPASTHL